MLNEFRRLPRGTAAFVIYALLSLWVFSPIPNLRKAYVGEGTDPFIFIWALRWWPWAMAHGLNPFITKFIWLPEEINLTWVVSVPTYVSILISAITLLSDAVVSWNLIALLSPALSAWAVFLLARHITRDFFASLVGGYIFGFSTYEMAQLRGHMHCYLSFIPPLSVLLALLRLRDRLTRIQFIVPVALLLLLQIGVSMEVFATTCSFAVISYLVFFPFADADGRRRLWRLAWESGGAMALMAFLAAPFLLYVVLGTGSVPEVTNPPQDYSIDLLNFLVPTPITALGKTVFASIASRFTGNYSESTGYLGLPLILALAASLQSPARYRSRLES